ncbi:hypothetical protein Tco_0779449 [Tanacetum coccineum]
MIEGTKKQQTYKLIIGSIDVNAAKGRLVLPVHVNAAITKVECDNYDLSRFIFLIVRNGGQFEYWKAGLVVVVIVNSDSVSPIASASAGVEGGCKSEVVKKFTISLEQYCFNHEKQNLLDALSIDLEQIDADDLEEMDLKWQVAMLTMRVKRFIKKRGRKLDLNGKETVGFDRRKGNRNRDDPRRNAPVDTSTTNALVVQDGKGLSSSSSSDSEYDVQVKDISIKDLKNQLEEALKKKDDSKLKLENFEESLKNLTKLINSQISAKNKTGLGYDSQMNESKLNNIHMNESEVVHSVFNNRENDVDLDVSVSSLQPKFDQTKSKFTKINFVKSGENVKSVNKENTHRQVEYPRKSQSPRDNRRNWNGMMTQKLGNGFEFIKKACFVCRSFNHLIKDYDFHDNKMVENPVLNNKGMVMVKGKLDQYGTMLQRDQGFLDSGWLSTYDGKQVLHTIIKKLKVDLLHLEAKFLKEVHLTGKRALRLLDESQVLLKVLHDNISLEDAVADDAGKKTTEEPANEGEKNGQEKDGGASNNEGDQNVQHLRAELDKLFVQQKKGYANSTNRVSTVSPSVSVVGQSFVNDLPTDPLIPDLEDTTDLLNTDIFSGAYDDEDMGAEADLNNLETTMNIAEGLEIGGFTQRQALPFGQIDPQFPDKVYKVEKALYGLHQALEPGSPLCVEFEQMLHKRIPEECLRGAHFLLKVAVKTASTPIKNNKELLKDEEAEDVDVHLYRSMIRSLMYLTASRPDIIFVFCACVRFQVTPKVLHLYAVKRIIRYLKGQPKLDLWYPRDSSFDLEAFSDRDYAGASLNRKSTT